MYSTYRVNNTHDIPVIVGRFMGDTIERTLKCDPSITSFEVWCGKTFLFTVIMNRP